MTSRLALGLILSGLAATTPVAAQKLTSFIPAKATQVTISHSDCKPRLLVDVWFRSYGGPELLRVAQTAAATYGYPNALMTTKDGDTYIRAVDVRDMPGMLKYLKGYVKLDGMRFDHIPADKRYAPIDEQSDAMDDDPPEYIAEMGGEKCTQG